LQVNPRDLAFQPTGPGPGPGGCAPNALHRRERPSQRLAGLCTHPYLGAMRSGSNVRAFALPALAFGLIALAFLASSWLLNPYPTGASCDTRDGYTAIKAHANTNGVLALLALASAAIGGVVCVAGVVKARGHRVAFLLGVVPLLPIGFLSLALLVVSGLYCQN
jgi:hypothetical protein